MKTKYFISHLLLLCVYLFAVILNIRGMLIDGADSVWTILLIMITPGIIVEFIKVFRGLIHND